MIVLKIALYVLLILLLLLIAALAAPVGYTLKGQRYENYFIRAEATWLFHALKFSFFKEGDEKSKLTVKILGFNVKVKSIHEKDVKKKSKKKKKKKDSKKPVTRGFINEIVRLVKDIFRHSKPKVFHAEGVYGFEDPFYTGLSCAIVNNLPSKDEGFSIKLKPVFDEEILEGRFLIHGRMAPAFILWLLVRFRLSRPVRNKFKKERKRKFYAN